MKAPTTALRTERWPAERFYWSRLQTAAPVSAGPVPLGLIDRLEQDLPESLDALHAVCVPVSDEAIVVCVARRSELARVHSGVVCLCPSSTPDGLGQLTGADPSRLNLLVGPFEPLPFRRARIRRHLTAMAAVIVCAALVVTGLVRRERDSSAATATARQSTAAALAAANAASELALADDLARARRENTGRLDPPPDAALALAQILSRWPRVASKPSTLSVAAQTAAIAVAVEDNATAFLDAFKAPPGWTLDEPQVSAAGSLTRLTLLLRREGRP